MNATAPLSLLLVALVAGAVAAPAFAADRGDRVEYRFDRRGDRADNRWDRKGERFDNRWDRRH